MYFKQEIANLLHIIQVFTAMCNTIDGDGNKYMMDYIDELTEFLDQLHSFRKTASSLVFGGFLDLANEADTDQFCNISDSYNYYNIYSIFILHILACASFYRGPQGQGLSGGLAYLIDFYTGYSVKMRNANLSNPGVVNALKADSTFALFGK